MAISRSQCRMAPCAFSCHGICRKKQIHQGAPGKKYTPPPEDKQIICSHCLVMWTMLLGWSAERSPFVKYVCKIKILILSTKH